jgi:hypothetical protein
VDRLRSATGSEINLTEPAVPDETPDMQKQRGAMADLLQEFRVCYLSSLSVSVCL